MNVSVRLKNVVLHGVPIALLAIVYLYPVGYLLSTPARSLPHAVLVPAVAHSRGGFGSGIIGDPYSRKSVSAHQQRWLSPRCQDESILGAGQAQTRPKTSHRRQSRERG